MKSRVLALTTLLAVALASAWWLLRPRAAPPAALAGRATNASPPPSVLPSRRPDSPRPQAANTGAAPVAGDVSAQDLAAIACGEAVTRVLRVRSERLAASDDARDRAIGALMLVMQPGFNPGLDQDRTRRYRAQLDDAVQRESDDPWLAWVSFHGCRAPGCDRRAARDHLLQVDGDNTLAWLAATKDALDADEPAQVERLLQRAAKAGHAESYWSVSARQAFERIGPIEPQAACTAEVLDLQGREWGRRATMEDFVIGQAVAIGSLHMPAYHPLIRLCPLQGPAPAHRQDTCRGIYANLAGSHEWLAQRLGAQGMEALAATPAERNRWRERRRQLAWLREQTEPLWTTTQVRLGWEYGEVPAMIGVLEEAGLWPPPPGWQPGEDR